MEMRELKTPMHPLKVIEEWRKGCSCSMDSNGNQLHPSLCEECTEAAMKAIERYYDVTDKPPVWGDWTPAK